MKSRLASVTVVIIFLALVQAAWGQWSSDPSVNLPLADNNNGSDQVQPKLVPLQKHGWYVSWFDANPATSRPVGYDVFYQRLNGAGVEQFPHDGLLIADLTNSSTEDYGMDADADGNELLAFLDTREGSNQQVTAEKLSPEGKPLWGKLGVQLTSSATDFNAVPKIVATSDGNVVVAWTSNSNVVLQEAERGRTPQWGSGVVFTETKYNYTLADMRAADNGSVIVSWARARVLEATHSFAPTRCRPPAACCGEALTWISST